VSVDDAVDAFTYATRHDYAVAGSNEEVRHGETTG
jgi:hypothetical protein